MGQLILNDSEFPSSEDKELQTEIYKFSQTKKKNAAISIQVLIHHLNGLRPFKLIPLSAEKNSKRFKPTISWYEAKHASN